MPPSNDVKARPPNRGQADSFSFVSGSASVRGMKRTYTIAIESEGGMSAIRVPFDPKAVFGKARAPVKVMLNGYTYRSTISDMGDGPWVPLRRSNREAAGVEPGATIEVTLELDTEERIVTPPSDLAAALKATPEAWEGWQALSFTHRREHAEAVESAKRPETRSRRIGQAVEAAVAKAAKKRA
jgi:hypothetical protein